MNNVAKRARVKAKYALAYLSNLKVNEKTFGVDEKQRLNRPLHLPNNKLPIDVKRATIKGNKFQDRLKKATHLDKAVRMNRLNKGISTFKFIQDFDKPLTLRSKRHKVVIITKNNPKTGYSEGKLKRVERQDLSATLGTMQSIKDGKPVTLHLNLKSSHMPKWFR